MNTRPSLYRTTLVAAALAIGCFGAAAAQAHDRGWHGQEDGHGWHERDRGWHGHDGYRGDGARYGYGGPVWRAGWAGLVPPPVFLPGLPAVYAPGGVSVVVRLPF